MSLVKVAVIGAGHLGQYHAAKYAQAPGVQLVGIADLLPDRAQALAQRHGCQAFADFRALLPQVEAVSIAVPAAQHYAIGKACLQAGLHVLMEKPITTTLEEADRLLALARARRRVLQVGHVERFNPVARELLRQVEQPLFIECHRLAPFKPRGTDVDVILDLMIHDLDLIAALAGGEVSDLDACGAPVLSDSADIANARVHFDNGCTANITASRVSLKVERKLRIFQRDAYFSADLHKQELTTCRRATRGAPLMAEHRRIPGDALEAEIAAFLAAVVRRDGVAVNGEDGRRALQLSLDIAAHLRNAGARPLSPSPSLPALHAD